MAHFIDLFSPHSYEAFAHSSRNISGFRTGRLLNSGKSGVLTRAGFPRRISDGKGRTLLFGIAALWRAEQLSLASEFCGPRPFHFD
jgi:hypothetical protein